MGAMLIVLWDLPQDPASPDLQDLSAFLGIQAVSAGLKPQPAVSINQLHFELLKGGLWFPPVKLAHHE